MGISLTVLQKKDQVQIRVGVCTLLSAIWNVRNDFIYNIMRVASFFQVFPLPTHWIYMWSYIQPEEKRQAMASGCSRLEMVAQIYTTGAAGSLILKITC